MFILASSVCKSLQGLISTLTQGGKGGHLFRLTCSVVSWGGRNTANKYHWHVWGVLAVYGSHWVCPSSWRHVPSRATLLRLQVALQGYCPKEALHFMHFPGLSCSDSGSWVLHRGTDSVGCVLCALTRFEQLSASQVHCPRWTMHLNRLPGPCHSVSRVCQESTVSGVLCFSSGELISGCDSPGRCQLSRVPRRLG